MTVIIDAIKMCDNSRKGLIEDVKFLKRIIGDTPKFVIINASDDSGNARYIENKTKYAKSIGIDVILEKFDSNCTHEDILEVIEMCNNLSIPVILQEPTYNHIDSSFLMRFIKPHVDADGFSVEAMGRLSLNTANVYPATPLGVINLLSFHDVKLEGKVALVVGKSNHVGKPMAISLMNEGATVISANSKTKDLDALARQADIIISCVGKLDLIKAKDIKRGAVLVGVGFSYVDGKQLLDFDIDEVVKDGKALLVTNRVNCTGKATVDALLRNVVNLYFGNLDNWEE